ncbi:hypothetical protein PG996_016023 [Apiospora saccharicola]|uniref:IdtB n=1 Tax=Apiospora saccharicola TaxID=335842 RepID=A0ABR1TQF1_9PEZI
MDGFNDAQPPPSYLEVQWLADLFVLLMGVGWLVNYVLMVWYPYTERTYSMAIIPLCCNLGWELAYTLVYPSAHLVEYSVFVAGVTLNLGIMVLATRGAPNEWRHSPLVANNVPFLFLGTTAVCFTGHVALAIQIGPGLAYSWGAVICQLGLSMGGLCQLLQRNSTRGTSGAMWWSRFLGSCCTVVFAGLRCKYWPEAFGWLWSPLVGWSLATFLLVDITYGFCYLSIRREEVRKRM